MLTHAADMYIHISDMVNHSSLNRRAYKSQQRPAQEQPYLKELTIVGRIMIKKTPKSNLDMATLKWILENPLEPRPRLRTAAPHCLGCNLRHVVMSHIWGPGQLPS